jgi:hypothetical protein
MTVQNDRTELKFGPDGYAQPPNPDLKAPAASIDRRKKVERLCMKARSLQVVSDGTLAGTAIMVDGKQVGGLVRFEMVAQRGYRRVTAVVDMNYDREPIEEHGELAGQEVRGDDGNPLTVTVDIFRRE